MSLVSESKQLWFELFLMVTSLEVAFVLEKASVLSWFSTYVQQQVGASMQDVQLLMLHWVWA